MEKIKSTLTEIPETMLTTLWAKAVETDRPDPLLRDEKAKEIIGVSPKTQLQAYPLKHTIS